MAASAPTLTQCKTFAEDNTNTTGGPLHEIATNLKAIDGKVPCCLEGLVDVVGLEDTLTGHVMQGVFGSAELVIGLHIRKLVCAVDFFDWEESGVSKKDELKMTKIPGGHVRKSLASWMPPGSGRACQDAVEALAEALGTAKIWGKLTMAVKRHFNSNDEKELMEMATNIVQFCKVAKKGGRSKASC